MTLALVGLLALALVLGHLERRAHAEERSRLTAAALAVTPQQAAAIVKPGTIAEPEARTRRPIPEGL